MRISSSLLVLPLLGSTASAWGAIGHEIVGTIAEFWLKDAVRQRICDIVGRPGGSCSYAHLANIANWADQIKSNPWWRSWSAQLHFVNAKGDWPTTDCEFGQKGWEDPKHNLLTAISNFTRGIQELTGQHQNESVRFIAHFIGDLHQPLHLAGREKGANNLKVDLDGRVHNLHESWDTDIVEKFVNENKEYTDPLEEKWIENALQGKQYDPYIRYIAKEGLLGLWKDEYADWASCDFGASHSISQDDSQLRLGQPSSLAPIPDDSSLPVCPYYWASQIHPLNCEIAYPPELDEPNPNDGWVKAQGGRKKEYLEIDTPQYIGRLRDDKTVEKLLAQAGVRLAAVLNQALDPEGNGDSGIVRPTHR